MYKIDLQKDYTVKVVEMIEDWCSGSKISRELGISRTAVWKIVSKLREVGYNIEIKKGKGYKLVKRPEISAYEVALTLIKKSISLIKEIHYFEDVDSTNEVAKKVNRDGVLVFAERQTAGKGRLGRKWFSEKGGLYFSITLKPNLSIDDVPKITLTAGLSVCEALNDLCLNAKLKWPNDVLIDGKKVCGILCEIVGEVDSPLVIVGIGVNVRNKIPDEIRNTATNISEHCDVKITDVFEKIVEKFYLNYKMLIDNKWENLRRRWIEKSDTIGREVVIKVSGKEYLGKATDLDKNGGLILDGETKIYSGECFYIKNK